MDITDRYANRQIGTVRFLLGYYLRLVALALASVRRSPTV